MVELGTTMREQRHALANIVLVLEVELCEDMPGLLAVSPGKHGPPRIYDQRVPA